MSRTRYIRKEVGELPVRPFADAEEAWFWWARCQKLRAEGARLGAESAETARPCDPDDLPLIAAGLARRRRLRRDHLKVLADYGLRESPPDPRRFDEEWAARLWDEAMEGLSVALREKGIVA